jgi:hypothetical protein
VAVIGLAAGGCAAYNASARLWIKPIELTLEPPGLMTRITPVTLTPVSVQTLKDTRPQRGLVTFEGRSFDVARSRSKEDVVDQTTRVLVSTLVAAGVPAKRAAGAVGADGITVNGFIRDFRVEQTRVGDRHFRPEGIATLELRVTGENGRDVHFVVNGRSFAEYEGEARLNVVGMLLNQAFQDAMLHLVEDPAAARAFAPP